MGSASQVECGKFCLSICLSDFPYILDFLSYSAFLEFFDLIRGRGRGMYSNSMPWGTQLRIIINKSINTVITINSSRQEFSVPAIDDL